MVHQFQTQTSKLILYRFYKLNWGALSSNKDKIDSKNLKGKIMKKSTNEFSVYIGDLDTAVTDEDLLQHFQT